MEPLAQEKIEKGHGNAAIEDITQGEEMGTVADAANLGKGQLILACEGPTDIIGKEQVGELGDTYPFQKLPKPLFFRPE